MAQNQNIGTLGQFLTVNATSVAVNAVLVTNTIVINSIAGISANGSYGTSGQALTTNGSAVYWSTIVGTNTAASYSWTNTHTFNNPIYANTVNATSYTVGSSTIANSTGVYAGVVNATTISTGSVNVVNAYGLTTTANVNIGAAGELIITAGAGIYANGGLGTAGQVLTSNASSVYWSTVSGSNTFATTIRQSFTANGTSGVFTVSGGYTSGYIDVYLNGAKLVNGTDVDVTSGSTVTVTPTPANGSVVDVVGLVLQQVVTESGSYYKGGATTVGSAGNANNIFRINGQTMYYDTNIGPTENGSCAGPLVIYSGKTLTIQTGGRVVIV